MLKTLLRALVRVALPFFAKTVRISHREQLNQKGPLVLALNHPNSFLDAVLLGAFMKEPVHFLARGDVFHKRWIRNILTSINMIPIYRIRDGKEKLSLNEQTFEKSKEVLNGNGILLVFVEGFCEHQTTLQLPLKKGAPRVIDACWRQGVPVKILPIWLHYSSFSEHPKEIDIRMGAVIHKPAAAEGKDPAVVWQRINEHTAQALQLLTDMPKPPEHFVPLFYKMLLALPAIMGAILHTPLYVPLQGIVRHATRNNVHYDSVLFALLIFLYPVYLLVLGSLLAIYVSGPWFLLPIVLLPLLARAYVLWK
jgi:1-acyl-sn-glycerol-3-phosphate acyltransferase